VALGLTLFVVPWGCFEAVVVEGSGARTEWCDGLLGFWTPFFSSGAPRVTLGSLGISVILLVVAVTSTLRRRSRTLAS
jgi:hypothetical protein